MSLESFARAATSGRCEAARRLLSAEIESDSWGRLILGRGWDGDVIAAGGPLGWAPLLYATHSCFASVDLVRSLLARGADPEASFENEYGSMSALYGAAGVVHSAEITRMLLEAGASPNDGESVYHSVEAVDPACLGLLLEHGGNPSDGLAHALDFDRLEPVRMLLEAGADASGNVLVHAVRRGRGPEFVQLLVAFGAPVDQPGGEGFRRDSPARTPYQHAVLRGLIDVAETLASLGADVAVTDEDLAVAALRALPASPDYDQQEAVILAALRGRLDTVVDLAGPDFGGVLGGSPHGNLLHHAAWLGDAEIVARLLKRGADPLAASPATFSTPLAWCYLGSSEWTEPGRDHVAVARALLAAGAVYEPRFADVAAGPLADARLTA
jgi:ankyrin repeat protein